MVKLTVPDLGIRSICTIECDLFKADTTVTKMMIISIIVRTSNLCLNLI